MKIYLSHPIRGINPNPTPEYIAANCKKAIDFVNILRLCFPKTEFYCPAEHEKFVQLAYDDGFLTIDQILQIDKEILTGCDAVIFYNHERTLSKGMLEEKQCAEEKGIPYAEAESRESMLGLLAHWNGKQNVFCISQRLPWAEKSCLDE
jgi:hypothetical protein